MKGGLEFANLKHAPSSLCPQVLRLQACVLYHKVFVVAVVFLFWFCETGSHGVALAVLELIL